MVRGAVRDPDCYPRGIDPDAAHAVTAINLYLPFPLVFKFGPHPYRAHARRYCFFRDFGWAGLPRCAPTDRRGELRALIEERNRLETEIDRRLSAMDKKLPGPEEIPRPSQEKRMWIIFFDDPRARHFRTARMHVCSGLTA